MTRSVPAACLPFIHTWEKGPNGSFAATTYIDVGTPCIGWGHRVIHRADPLLHTAIDRKRADQIAIDDLTNAAADVEKALPARIVSQLTEGMFAALTVFMFNVGAKQFGGSTLRQKLIDGKFDEAAAEFGKWIYITVGGSKRVSEGLVNRRTAETALFKS